MSRLAALFATTTLISTAVAAQLWQKLHAERALTAQLQQQQGTGSARSSSPGVPQPAGAPAGDLPAWPGATAATTTMPPATGAVVPPKAVVVPAVVSDRPRTSAKFVQLQNRYPGLVKELNLTTDEAEAFFDLLTKQEASLNPAELLKSLQGPNGAINIEDLQRKRAEIEKAQAAELAAQLGPARSAQWADYQKTVEARRRVNELTMTLSTTAPLAEEQVAPLLANIIEEHRRRDEDQSRRGPVPTDPRGQLEYETQTLKEREASNRRSLAAAQSFMTAEQIAVMQTAMNRRNEDTRRTLQSRREMLDRVERNGGVPAPQSGQMIRLQGNEVIIQRVAPGPGAGN